MATMLRCLMVIGFPPLGEDHNLAIHHPCGVAN